MDVVVSFEVVYTTDEIAAWGTNTYLGGYLHGIFRKSGIFTSINSTSCHWHAAAPCTHSLVATFLEQDKECIEVEYKRYEEPKEEPFKK